MQSQLLLLESMATSINLLVCWLHDLCCLSDFLSVWSDTNNFVLRAKRTYHTAVTSKLLEQWQRASSSRWLQSIMCIYIYMYIYIYIHRRTFFTRNANTHTHAHTQRQKHLQAYIYTTRQGYIQSIKICSCNSAIEREREI